MWQELWQRAPGNDDRAIGPKLDPGDQAKPLRASWKEDQTYLLSIPVSKTETFSVGSDLIEALMVSLFFFTNGAMHVC